MSNSCNVPPLGEPVYISSRLEAVGHPVEFVPMDHLAQDDELVYRVSLGGAPTLLSTRALAGKKSLSFDGLLAGAYVLALVDSGATHSFVSFQYLNDNHISYDPVSVPEAKLADGTMIRILGVTRLVEVKLGAFRFKHRFLVVDMDSYDCVLGMSF
jgi:hypothetical protein